MQLNLNVNMEEEDMNSHFQNIYYVENGYGSCFTLGLRKFNRFFYEKNVENLDSPCMRIALMIGQIVLGVFAYPILGIGALIGLAINEIDLRCNNCSFKNWAIENINNFKTEPLLTTSSRFSIEKNTQANSFNQRRSTTSMLDESSFAEFQSKAVEEVTQAIDNFTTAGLFVVQVDIKKQIASGAAMLSTNELAVKWMAHMPEQQYMLEYAVEQYKKSLAASNNGLPLQQA